MPDTPNFTPLFVVLGSVGGVALLGTPVLWRALRWISRRRLNPEA